jgi:putative transposase
MRRRHSTWGPRKLHQRLKVCYGKSGLPSRATLGRWLRHWGMIEVNRVRRPRGPKIRRPSRLPLRSPNDVWTADFKGWFRLGNGRRVEPLTVRDSLSRYTLAVHLMRQQNIAETIPVFRRLFHSHGLPKRIRVDNGSPFGSKGPLGLTRLSAWWIKQGIAVEFGRAAHPEDNAGHEQFHRVMKAETANPPAHTWRGQQRRTQRWIRQYNQDRPHEALQMRVPAQLYRPSSRKFSEQRKPLRYPPSWESRQVKSNGDVSWRGKVRFIAEAFARERIGLKRLRIGVWHVYFGKIMIGELRQNEPRGMRPVVYERNPRK